LYQFYIETELVNKDTKQQLKKVYDKDAKRRDLVEGERHHQKARSLLSIASIREEVKVID